MALEQRAIDALTAMGFLMTDICINYQTIVPPAFGDTVTVDPANGLVGIGA